MEPESFANSQSASRNIANPQSVREFVNLASMDEPQSLVLRAWEAVSRERHLQGVLEAVTEVLLPHVPFFSIGIIALEGERHDLYALHVVGVPHREGETMREFLRRREPDNPPPLQVPSRPLIPYPDMTGKTGKPGAGWPPAPAKEVEPVTKPAIAPMRPIARKKTFGPGSAITHLKYGRGTVLRREGEGDDAKLTVSFPQYGLKKLVEKYAGIRGEE